jgi:4-methyl-5(b-hydroxyethyl)-thiazole monophosphate biosynthesis
VYDAIALPGGIPGAEHLRDSTPLVEMVKKQQQEGRLYAAICASPAVVFQHHGLLAGRKATCHPAFVKYLENQEVVENRVVVDGMCVTSRGPGTAIEFALQLITLLFDEEQAKKVAGPMLVLS